MTKREAKIEALRLATAMLHNPPCDWDDTDYTEEDVDKILIELSAIAKKLQERAVRLGGDFNQYTGFVESDK